MIRFIKISIDVNFVVFCCRHCLYVHHRWAAFGEDFPAEASRHPRQRVHSILLVCRNHCLHLGGNSKLVILYNRKIGSLADRIATAKLKNLPKFLTRIIYVWRSYSELPNLNPPISLQWRFWAQPPNLIPANVSSCTVRLLRSISVTLIVYNNY